MKRALPITLVLAGMLVPVLDAAARPGAHGGHHGGHRHAGARTHVTVTAGFSPQRIAVHHPRPVIVPRWYYAPPVLAVPYYVAPPVVAAVPAPITYVEMAQSQPPAVAAPPRSPADYWYYCADTSQYFPDVTECGSGWMTVVPNGGSPPR